MQEDNVKEWTKEAKDRGSKGFVDICDTWDYDHYPVFFGGPDDDYATGEQAVKSVCNNGNMQRNYGIYHV